MQHGRGWRRMTALAGAMALGGGLVWAAVHGAAAAQAEPASVTQWGTVRSVSYHGIRDADTQGLLAIVEMFDGRRFVHTVSPASRRIPAPGEVWNIDGDTPPPGWKARK